MPPIIGEWRVASQTALGSQASRLLVANVTLGITLIMLIQLNDAIGPRLPILSRL